MKNGIIIQTVADSLDDRMAECELEALDIKANLFLDRYNVIGANHLIFSRAMDGRIMVKPKQGQEILGLSYKDMERAEFSSTVSRNCISFRIGTIDYTVSYKNSRD